jgi:acyl-CoA thioester hydrolase
MTETFELPVRVYYEDTDAQGVVYYANYFRFMERARTEWLRSLGVDMVALQEQDRRIFVVAEVNVKFHAPARTRT